MSFSLFFWKYCELTTKKRINLSANPRHYPHFMGLLGLNVEHVFGINESKRALKIRFILMTIKGFFLRFEISFFNVVCKNVLQQKRKDLHFYL